MSERKDPIHIWTNPLHDSIDGMTDRQKAALDRSTQIEIHFDEAYELALLEANVPIQFVSAALRSLAPVRERERREYGSTAIRELLWKMEEPPNESNRRVLLGNSGESLRESAALDRVKKSTLHRKEIAFKAKWDSATPVVE